MRLSRPFELITPTVDGDILAVLGRAEGPFSGRQIQRLVGARSEAGIRKGLDRLVEQGIVLRRRVGNTSLHTLNREHLAADAVVAIARLREVALNYMVGLIECWPVKPLAALVFGSVARRSETALSDLDVMFVLPDSADDEIWQQAVSNFSSKASRATGNDVRPIVFTKSEILDERNSELRNQVIADGIVLVGSKSVLRNGLS